MVFCEPVATLGGKLWWSLRRQDSLFVLQEHKIGKPVWFGAQYRILIKANNHQIASADVLDEIEKDYDVIMHMKRSMEIDDTMQAPAIGTYLLQFFQERWTAQDYTSFLEKRSPAPQKRSPTLVSGRTSIRSQADALLVSAQLDVDEDRASGWTRDLSAVMEADADRRAQEGFHGNIDSVLAVLRHVEVQSESHPMLHMHTVSALVQLSRVCLTAAQSLLSRDIEALASGKLNPQIWAEASRENPPNSSPLPAHPHSLDELRHCASAVEAALSHQRTLSMQLLHLSPPE